MEDDQERLTKNHSIYMLEKNMMALPLLIILSLITYTLIH